MTEVRMDSEVGPLRRILLHPPGLELRRLTPSNCDNLLFDDVLWVRRAREEHRAFAQTLVERGVEVVYVGDLLAETVKDDDARRWLLDREITMVRPDLFVGDPRVLETLRTWTLTPGNDAGDVVVTPQDGLFSTLERVLGEHTIHVLTTGGDGWESAREQWDDGNNLLALSPGVVVRPHHGHRGAGRRGSRASRRRRHPGVPRLSNAANVSGRRSGSAPLTVRNASCGSVGT